MSVGGLGGRMNRGGGGLWVPWDRTAGVIGPQGSGKTLDLLTPALLGAPGAALVTLTKVDDLLLSFGVRSSGDRPCRLDAGRAAGEGVYGWHGQVCSREWAWGRCRTLLCGGGGESHSGVLSRRR